MSVVETQLPAHGQDLIQRPSTDLARLDPLLESVTEAFVTVDSRGAIGAVNQAAESLFGYPRQELIGRSFAALLGDPYRTEYAGYLQAFVRGQQLPVLGVPREILGRRSDGSSFPIELTITPINQSPERMLVAVGRDISERKRAEDRLRYLADADALTGLLNRRRFEQELEKYVDYSARYEVGGTVLLAGIDNFKYVNDSVGHASGDELIKAVAGLMRTRLRRTDLLARLSGDQFAMLLHGTDLETARTIAEELRELVAANPFVLERQGIRVTLSIGLAPLTEERITGGELLSRADQAMYAAKEKGRNTIAEFTPEGREAIEARRVWAEKVREATEQGRFVLMAQPIQELSTGKITQHEILIRMRGEDQGLVPPGAFLPVAERFGLIQGIDRWVAQQAVRMIGRHKRAGKDLVLEVNLSAKTMEDPDFATTIGREMVKAQIEPSNLVFEVTETAAVADIQAARKFAESLTRLGCRFALDDFGSGFASFYYLKHLPISYLKIDGEFVKDLPRTPTDQLMIKALVGVAQGMGIKTVAEYVEDQETLDLLREMGVTYGQGFHISRPVPASELSVEKPEAIAAADLPTSEVAINGPAELPDKPNEIPDPPHLSSGLPPPPDDLISAPDSLPAPGDLPEPADLQEPGALPEPGEDPAVPKMKELPEDLDAPVPPPPAEYGEPSGRPLTPPEPVRAVPPPDAPPDAPPNGPPDAPPAVPRPRGVDPD